jgi:hypothetical protein
MRIKIIIFVFVLLLATSVFLTSNLYSNTQDQTSPDVYVGIDLAYGNFETTKELVNEVSSYTNLFIIGCTATTHNVTELDKTCQYLYDKNFSFIIYQSQPTSYDQGVLPTASNWTRPFNASNLPRPPTSSNWTLPPSSFNWTRTFNIFPVSNWTETAKTRWGKHFLGIYYNDESGGRQLDLDPDWMVVRNATSYEDASNQFNINVGNSVNWFRGGYSNWTDLSLFTSDYTLYHFDYKAGYDVLFAQLGWNYSRQLNMALCRGAATIQNKDWGVIVTWEYTSSPYLESGDKLYSDLVLAYDNGAKYIVVFDSNEDYTQGILREEHLNALKQFWQYIKENPRSERTVSERVGFVLPKDYAYGFRGPDDKIWGLWGADTLSYNLSVSVNSLLEQYGDKLDIIYDDGLQLGKTYGYKQLIYWNDSSLIASIFP